jgi:hypothetical protein
MRSIALLTGDETLGQAQVHLGLPDELWSNLYHAVMDAPELPSLARIWRHQYGAEADHIVEPAEIPVLLVEIAALRRRHVSPLAEPEAADFFERFEGVCREAERLQARLAFIAD